jgi:endoglucanase
VDLGLPVKQVREVVSVGDMVTLHREFAAIGDTVCCKAMDNRLACYIMIEAMRRARRAGFEVWAVATSQEEVGLRGAQVAAYDVRPDVAIALDVTIAADLPEMPGAECVTRLGDGTAIKIMDSSTISSPPVVAFLKALAEKRQIKYQMEILPRGGTDAGAMQRARAGAPTATLSTPTRYVHTSIEMVHRDDIEASIQLLTAFVEEGDAEEFSL